MLLEDAAGNVLADGTFLPGVFSEIHGSGFYDFTGNVNFFYLNSAIYGTATGTGDISVEYDPTINFASPDMPGQFRFSYDIFPTQPTVATPELPTICLLLLGASISALVRKPAF